jgi:hypothetical protein
VSVSQKSLLTVADRLLTGENSLHGS